MSDFFGIFGDTYLPMSYTLYVLSTYVLCLIFLDISTLPKIRTSFIDVPLRRPDLDINSAVAQQKC